MLKLAKSQDDMAWVKKICRRDAHTLIYMCFSMIEQFNVDQIGKRMNTSKSMTGSFNHETHERPLYSSIPIHMCYQLEYTKLSAAARMRSV